MFSKPHPPPPRRTHRKRISVSRLSSDTTSTLPEYHQATPTTHLWQRQLSIEEDIPSDKPPDYPDSAEEADEDTDPEDHRNPLFVQHLPTGTSTLLRSPHTTVPSPRRRQRFQQHKRKHSLPPLSPEASTDPYLDSLLERSVHALEMSNTLLQSSITTQTSLSTLMAPDSPADQTLEARAVNLSARIRGKWDMQESWADDLEEISRNVNGLFGDGFTDGLQETGRDKTSWNQQQLLPSPFTPEGSLSSSLPSDSPLQLQQRRPYFRRPSLDLRQAASESSGEARLRLAQCTREDLIAPPPRALTQYVETGADPAFITLPPTLGLRSSMSMHPNADWNASTTSLHSSPALPIVTDTPLESSSTPAYTKLASFVIKRPSVSVSTTPSSSFTSSFMIGRRNSSAEGGRRRSSPLSSPRKSFEIPRVTTNNTQLGTPLPHSHRPMTPPAEESSSSESCVAKQTIVSLRKILDEQPIAEDAKSTASSSSSHKRMHAFMPRTPVPAPVSGTSTATASISKMLTKKVHHSSTRPPSPPRQSALKGSRSATPSPTTATLSIPEIYGVKMPSAPSSGRSTPKRISFAELPEAHVSSHPEKFKDKGKKKKGSARGSKPRLFLGGDGRGEEEESGSGWLSGWFGASGGSLALARHEQKMEDRTSRSWGGRMGGGGYGYMDEWAV